MKKILIISFAFAMLTLGCTKKELDSPDSKPLFSIIMAPDESGPVSFTISVTDVTKQESCWIDLNNDGIRNEHESFAFITNQATFAAYEVEAGTVIDVYGDIDFLHLSYSYTVSNIVFSKNQRLRYLYLEGCFITSLNLTNNEALKELRIRLLPKLHSLELPNSIQLLHLTKTAITSLNVAPMSDLRSLYVTDPSFDIEVCRSILFDLPNRTPEDNAVCSFNNSAISAADRAFGSSKNWTIY